MTHLLSELGPGVRPLVWPEVVSPSSTYSYKTHFSTHDDLELGDDDD